MDLFTALSNLLQSVPQGSVGRTTLDWLIRAIDLADPELGRSPVEISPTVDDVEVYLFDLAAALEGSNCDAAIPLVSILRGLGHALLSEDDSRTNTIWVHDGPWFGRSGVFVTLDRVVCPNCGNEDVYRDFVSKWNPSDASAVCPSCSHHVSLLVVAVTVHSTESTEEQ